MKARVEAFDAQGLLIEISDGEYRSREIYTPAQLASLGYDGTEQWVRHFLRTRMTETESNPIDGLPSPQLARHRKLKPPPPTKTGIEEEKRGE